MYLVPRPLVESEAGQHDLHKLYIQRESVIAGIYLSQTSVIYLGDLAAVHVIGVSARGKLIASSSEARVKTDLTPASLPSQVTEETIYCSSMSSPNTTYSVSKN